MRVVIMAVGSRGDVAPYTGLGVTPGPVPFGRLTADRLAAALTEVTGNPGYRQRTHAVARRIAGEDGAGAVAKLLRI